MLPHADGAVIPPKTQLGLEAASGFDITASTSRSFLVRTTGGPTFAWGLEQTGGEIPTDVRQVATWPCVVVDFAC